MNSLNEPNKAKLSIDPMSNVTLMGSYGYNFVDNHII